MPLADVCACVTAVDTSRSVIDAGIQIAARLLTRDAHLIALNLLPPRDELLLALVCSLPLGLAPLSLFLPLPFVRTLRSLESVDGGLEELRVGACGE